MKRETKKESRAMWGLIYGVTFTGVFLLSAIFKMTYDPLGMRVDWSGAVGTVYTDLSYGEGPANKFDLYLPADDTKEAYGLVVYLHAGGFTAGDKSDDAEILKWLCSRGYAAAGVNYTLLSEEHPEASVYSQSVEIRESIPSIAAEAEKRGYHLDRIAVAGGSAGGCLALIYAYRDGPSSPIPVKMVFEAVGPASFHHEDWTCYGLDKSSEAASVLFSAMSGNVITPEMIGSNDYAAEVRDISADVWVNGDSVPTLCAYGTHDRICPFPAGPSAAGRPGEKRRSLRLHRISPLRPRPAKRRQAGQAVSGKDLGIPGAVSGVEARKGPSAHRADGPCFYL